MAKLTIQENIWQDLVHAARRHKKTPDDLANEVLREFLQRQEDEEFLDRSGRAARKAPFDIRDTEELIRQYRKRKKKP